MKYVIALLALTFMTTEAVGQTANPVAPRTKVVKNLKKKYGETVVGRGLASGGTMIEVLASHDGETWTLILTQPDGTSRLITSGNFWQTFKPEIQGDDS